MNAGVACALLLLSAPLALVALASAPDLAPLLARDAPRGQGYGVGGGFGGGGGGSGGGSGSGYRGSDGSSAWDQFMDYDSLDQCVRLYPLWKK